MSDEEQVSQALAELWDVVKCRCHEAYTGRGLHDPDCQCDSTDAVQTVADRIEALIEESGRRLALARSEGVARVEQFERNEALTEQLNAARQDAKEAEAYAEELEKELNTCRMAQAVMDNTVADLEAKLTKAVAGLELIAGVKGPYSRPFPEAHEGYGAFAVVKSREALDELEGEK